MTPRARKLRDALEAGGFVDVRGHGKAGGGLLLAMQAFARALAATGGYHVHDWPLFSAARKGATVCGYLRLSRAPFSLSCQITEPDIAILMNAEAAADVDFAEGTRDALFVVNSEEAPEAVAARYDLGGTVATVGGDALGVRHLGRPFANIAILAALVRTTGLADAASVRVSLEQGLRKHRLSERLVAPNLALYDEALDAVRVAETQARDPDAHRPRPFQGYGRVPVGAQSALRTSVGNRTSAYGRAGVRVEFRDPEGRCNGCSLCVVQCPEGIVDFEPDPARGAIVHGARFEAYCKACTECVVACPLDLFHEVRTVGRGGEEVG